jgi:hypothetical protein
MKTRNLEPMEVSEEFPAPINPFHQDSYHMGVEVAKNVMVMYGSSDVKGNVPYIIVINTMTGERKEVRFSTPLSARTSFMEWVRYLSNPRISLREKLVRYFRNYGSYAWWNKRFWHY